MKKPAPDEFQWIERFAFKLSVRAVAIAQHDAPALVITEHPAFAEGRLLHVGREVTQSGAPASCPLHLGHPGLLPGGGFDSRKDLGMIAGERLIDCLACRMRQRFLWEKILFVARMSKLAAAWSETHCWDQHMDVGMKEHPPCPGVQDRYESDVSAQELPAGAQRLQRAGNGSEERRIQLLRKMQEHTTHLLRNRKRQQIIGHWQEPRLLTARPLCLLACPAARTRPVIAAVINVMMLLAVGTMMQVAATARRAAAQHRLDRSPRPRGDRPAGLLHVSRPVLAEHLREIQASFRARIARGAPALLVRGFR